MTKKQRIEQDRRICVFAMSKAKGETLTARLKDAVRIARVLQRNRRKLHVPCV